MSSPTPSVDRSLLPRWPAIVLAGAAAAFSLTVLLKNLSGGFGWAPVAFVLWVLLPYALVIFGAARSRSALARWLFLAAAVVCALGNGLYYEAMFVSPDAQGALVFLIVPPLQALATAVLALPLLFFRRS